MPFEERKNILSHLEMVDEVIGFEDDAEGSCKNALLKILNDHPNDEIIFCSMTIFSLLVVLSKLKFPKILSVEKRNIKIIKNPEKIVSLKFLNIVSLL